MHVTFVTLGMELLGVEYLSSYLKANGHRTSLAHNPALFNDRFQLHIPVLARMFDRDDELVDRILRLDPDLLAFSCLTNVFAWSIEIAKRVRARKKIPTIFGGVHPSAVPEFVMGYSEVDYVCVSEGEVPLNALCDALEAHSGDRCDIDATDIPNIWSKPGGKITAPKRVARFLTDLNALPFPDKELFAPAIPKRYVYRMMTGRGCPYRCTFCFNNFFANLPSERTSNREYLRRRSVDNCLEELRLGKARDNFRAVEFHDDIFTLDKPWLREFLPRFKQEIGVPWVCETHAKFMDDEIAQLMKDTGCVGSKLGIQSLDRQDYKIHTLKRVEKEEDIVRSFEAFRKAGLQLDADHIFGLPGESAEALDHALEFYQKHTPGRIATFFLTYFPAIEITVKAHANGELTDAQMTDIHRGKVLWYHQVHASTPKARERLRENAAYMAAFQMLPAVPARLRRFVHPSLIGKIPGAVLLSRVVMAARMLLDTLSDGNFGAVQYLRLYLHHILGEGRTMYDVPPSDGSPLVRTAPVAKAPEPDAKPPTFVSAGQIASRRPRASQVKP